MKLRSQNEIAAALAKLRKSLAKYRSEWQEIKQLDDTVAKLQLGQTLHRQITIIDAQISALEWALQLL